MNQPIILVLISTGLLLTGHGLQLSLLPLYASDLGWSELEIGLTGTTYFLGFVTGCFTAGKLLARVGHIRVFMSLTALTAFVLLALESVPTLTFWLAGRFVTGWCLVGIYTTVESWLNEHAENHFRGLLISIYIIVTLVGMFVGQVLLGVLPAEHLFTCAASVIIVGILPVGLFCDDQPSQIAPVKIDVRTILVLPRLAVLGLLLGGLVTGSIWTLAPLTGQSKGFDIATIGWMMNAIILGGALLQLPMGRASDIAGRRSLILAVALLTAISATTLLVLPNLSTAWFLSGMFLFGGASLTLYGLCAADIQDKTSLGRVETSALVLMLNGIGSVAGPLFAGLLSQVTTDGLLALSLIAMGVLFFAGLFSETRPRANVLLFQSPGHVQAPSELEEVA